MRIRQIVLDTETTGLSVQDGHRIIEVAAVELINRKLTGQYFHHYVCPKRQIDSGAQAVHGISETFLADKPEFYQIISTFLDFIQGAELIIHNAPFDVGFLNKEFKLAGTQFKAVTDHCTIFDTLQLARKMHPSQHNSLDALCKRYSINNAARQLHGALLDSHLLASVYLAMTGGQTSLFSETAVALESTNLNFSNVTAQAQASVEKNSTLKIIYANTDELKSHQERLQLIKQTSGICLWLDQVAL